MGAGLAVEGVLALRERCQRASAESCDLLPEPALVPPQIGYVHERATASWLLGLSAYCFSTFPSAKLEVGLSATYAGVISSLSGTPHLAGVTLFLL